MFVANNLIFDSTATAANGTWRDVSNWVAYSVHVTGLEGTTWIEVSNDPAVKTDGATIAAPSAPVLSQYTPTSDSHVKGVTTNTTFFVTTTYVTTSGETVASAESSLLVTAGNLLTVASPAHDAGGYANGWNVYISTTTGTETIQNLVSGAVITPLQFGQSFILSALVNGPAVPPLSNTTGSPNVGVNITGNLAASPYVYPTGAEEMQVITDPSVTKQAMVNPSCLVWNFIRVCKTGGSGLETKAFLFGQQG
jgi:hypothetical protein